MDGGGERKKPLPEQGSGFEFYPTQHLFGNQFAAVAFTGSLIFGAA